MGADTFYETWGHHYTATDMDVYLKGSFNEEVILEQLEKEIFWVCLLESEPVGYAKLRKDKQERLPDTSKYIELQRIYVYQKYHGTGAAHLILQTVIDYVTKEGYDTLWLGVYEENKRAVNFYARYGFEVFGEWEFKAGDKVDIDLLVKKDLTKTSSQD
eukprot:TRINITY_DN3454_c0_g1_i1.p1 TRINITY_DN3454_c0_g1~~TRINITY_DN3454_c0_g1_i1.p1  ORF type:complete len:159 (-),score=33.72 TRINITY_DN3454_c0_g1_i1:24-500(-)